MQKRSHILSRKLLQNETHLPALRLHNIQKKSMKESRKKKKKETHQKYPLKEAHFSV